MDMKQANIGCASVTCFAENNRNNGSELEVASVSRIDRGALGRPCCRIDPFPQDRGFLRLAAFSINSESTTGSLFHHCPSALGREGR
jgi:hypothetical protein